VKYLREYYIPVVVKSPDYLCGFLDNLNLLSDVVSFDPTILDSSRFSEYLHNDQKRSEVSVEEIKELTKNHKESFDVKENENENSSEKDYFNVSCTCGNFYSFKHPVEIPEHNLKCGICERLLIDYTGVDDYRYDYSGNVDLMHVEFDGEDEEDSSGDFE
jgi:hypothetical protein